MWLPSFFRTKDVPFERKFNQHDTGVFRTPDAPVLEAKAEHLVFIYDNMMKDRAEYALISDLVKDNCFLGPALALLHVECYISKFTNKIIAFPAFNGPRPSWTTNQAPIRGHIFKMPAMGIFELDKMYGNNVYSKREETLCEVWNKKIRNGQCIDLAWIYLGIPDKWELNVYREWEPLQINDHNKYTPEKHYYHSSRR